MMSKPILLLSLVLLLLGLNAFGDVWYSQNFDGLEDGDIVGQDEWQTTMGQQACEVQDDVKHGDTGKSLLITEGTMVVRNFKDTHAGVQYVSLYARKDASPGTLMIYIGGDVVKWGCAAKFDLESDAAIDAKNGDTTQVIAKGELEKWHHFRVVFDFDARTYDLYVDGDQVADDFGFRGEGGKGGVNPSLGWMFVGWDQPEALVSYIDDIEMGDGEGGKAGLPKAVSAVAKLATTWGNIKER